jgi:HPt (histidine-containing phosphotransfer) domain-containing protein
MTEYISKPLDARKLVQTVERLGTPDGTSVPSNAGAAEPKGKFDFRRALGRLENDTQLFRDLSEFLKQDAPALLSRIRDAANCQDAARLEIAAHSLKGLVKNFDADRAVAAAAYIETHAREGTMANLSGAIEELQHETAALESALDHYLRTTA